MTADLVSDEQQPMPGVIGFVAPSVITTIAVRAAIAGEASDHV